MPEVKLAETVHGSGATPGPVHPVRVYINGGKGYVWSADDARELREKCRIMGVMVGGLAGYRQQVAVSGLPLELSNEELSLANDRGWVHLVADACPLESASSSDKPAAASSSTDPPASTPGSKTVQGKSVYYKPPSKKKKPSTFGKEAPPSLDEWHRAVHGLVTINVARPPDQEPAPDHASPVMWDYPKTSAHRLRCRVFADLHSRGYTLTSGVKFGADFLAYPGDPVLYHAQFCVKVMAWDAPINPYGFAASTRVAHTARKHLLMASEMPSSNSSGEVSEGQMAYFSVAPDMLQSSNKRRFAAPKLE